MFQRVVHGTRKTVVQVAEWEVKDPDGCQSMSRRIECEARRPHDRGHSSTGRLTAAFRASARPLMPSRSYRSREACFLLDFTLGLANCETQASTAPRTDFDPSSPPSVATMQESWRNPVPTVHEGARLTISRSHHANADAYRRSRIRKESDRYMRQLRECSRVRM